MLGRGGKLRAAALVAALCLGFVRSAAAEAELPKMDQKTPVLLTADQVDYDRENSIVRATGNVEIAQGARILKADTVSYNQKTGVVMASGHVSLTEPTGEVIFAEKVELTKEMREGVIDNIRMLFPDESRFAANGAVRTGGNRTEMRKATFSPCKLCETDPTKPPLWQIKADKVVHDQAAQRIEYYDGSMEIFGVPVAYAPVFWHPDPTVKRRSGFLTPTFGRSSQLGASAQVPYYMVLSPDWDATFAPIFYTEERPVAAGEVRHRFKNGEFKFFGSLTQAHQRSHDGEIESGSQLRGHVFADGRFDIDETWRGGFDAALSLDDTYLRLYDFSSKETLVNRGFVEGFRGRTYASAEGFYFQGMRSDENQEEIPVVAPYLNYNFVSEPLSFGGRWTLDANLLGLTREVGTDSRRLSAITGWQMPLIGPIGDVVTFSANLQTDLYWVNGVAVGNNAGASFNGIRGRVFPQAMVDWRYPLVRDYGNVRQLLEPRIAGVIGPNGRNPGEIPNEDSIDLEFDDTNLFSRDRFPGIDRVESGQRLIYGLRSAFYGDAGGQTEIFIGQSYRLREDDLFRSGSGLEDHLSDVVGRVTVRPADYLDLSYRFRLDHDTFKARRNEVRLSAGPTPIRLSLNYLFLDEDTDLEEFGSREEISANLTVRLDARPPAPPW